MDKTYYEEIPQFPPLKEKKENKIIGILPRKTYFWTEDDKVDKCFKCNIAFNWLQRKHHCRNCGRIFCYECSKYGIYTNKVNSMGLIISEEYLNDCLYKKQNINTGFISYMSGYGYGYGEDIKYQRLCYDCLIIYNKINEVSQILKILELLSLSISDIYKVRGLNKIWYEASNIYLSKISEIQYLLPNYKLTICEHNVLHNNLKIIVCHNKLLCRYFKSNDWDSDKYSLLYIKNIIHTNDIIDVKCKYLMCDKNCMNMKDNKLLTDEEILDILTTTCNMYVREFLIELFDEKLIGIYIPLLIYSLRYDYNGNIVSDYLLDKSMNDFDLQQKLYCELLIHIKNPIFSKYYDKTYDVLLNIISTYSDIEKINNLNNFINYVNTDKIRTYFGDVKKQLIAKNGKNMIPLDILYIDYDNIKIFNSNTCPKLIPYINSNYEYKSLIYKFEDVRNDYIIQCIIKSMDLILKNNGLDMNIVTYDVLPISNNSGLIEIVQNSETIYNIKNKHNTTILNYILEKNSNDTIENIRDKFIKSTASYSIISYLLGIGDRHLDNIMITNDGKLFHIDYSYILGIDCKLLAPKIRLTPDIIECIGGLQSKNYEIFEKYCIQVYNILRSHVNIYSCFFNMLTNKNNADAEIKRRFLIGEYNEQANIQLIKTIEVSQATYSYVDFIHHHYKDTLSPLTSWSWKNIF